MLCVNALSRANPISTGWSFLWLVTSECVSMPCLGRIPFLPSKKSSKRSSKKSVSMPCLGRIPFLPGNGGETTDNGVCQCPVSGESHFYRFQDRQHHNRLSSCQCPVSGESHFYEEQDLEAPHSEEWCQCPVSGESHFYEIEASGDIDSKEDVSMPCLGRIPFLLMIKVSRRKSG